MSSSSERRTGAAAPRLVTPQPGTTPRRTRGRARPAVTEPVPGNPATETANGQDPARRPPWGTAIRWIERMPFEGPVMVEVAGERHALGTTVAHAIFVSADGPEFAPAAAKERA